MLKTPILPGCVYDCEVIFDMPNYIYGNFSRLPKTFQCLLCNAGARRVCIFCHAGVH